LQLLLPTERLSKLWGAATAQAKYNYGDTACDRFVVSLHIGHMLTWWPLLLLLLLPQVVLSAQVSAPGGAANAS
jgi:hypothetical protein